MALVMYGAGIIEMRGSIAGNTYAKNRYGKYVRAKTKPVNPKSDRQIAARATVSMLAAAWHVDLDADQRGAWDTYAAAIAKLNKLGETVHWTGFNHFISCNAARNAIGAAIVEDGPTTLALPSIDNGFAVTGGEAAARLNVSFDGTDDWDDADGNFMIIQMGQPQLVTRTFFGGPYRNAEELPGAPGVDPPSPVTRFPSFTLTEGQKVWCRHRISLADGRLSTLGGAAPFIVDA